MTRPASQLITDPVETPGADRVRSHTDPEQSSELDREAAQALRSDVRSIEETAVR